MEMENLKNLRCLQTKGMGCMFHLIGNIACVFDARVMLCNVMRACCSSLVYSASVELGDPSKAAIPVSVGRLFQPQTSKHLPLRRPLYVHTQHFAQPFA